MSLVVSPGFSPVSLPRPVSRDVASVTETSKLAKNWTPDALSLSHSTQPHPPTLTAQPAYTPFQLKFGAIPAYRGPFDSVVLYSDFNDDTSNTEAILRFRDVFKFVDQQNKGRDPLPGFDWSPWVKEKSQPEQGGFLDVRTFSNIPYGNKAYSATSLLRLAGRPGNHDIIVHVVDPGVGNGKGHNRSILFTTDDSGTPNGGVLIGPNNGSLGLIAQFYEARKIPYVLGKIDAQKVERLEQARLQDPNYAIPDTFHGRDLFAVVAASVAAGLDPRSFVEETFSLQQGDYAKTAALIKEAPTISEGWIQGAGIRDNTFGNVKTNIALTPALFFKLLNEGAFFEIQNANQPGHVIHAPLKAYFGQVPEGTPLIYLGSTYTPDGKARYLEVAINGTPNNTASEALDIHLTEPTPLKIRRENDPNRL